MTNGSRRGFALALLVILGTILPAHGQMGGAHSGRQKNQQQTSKASLTPSPPETLSDTSSQLLPGAILCNSDDDLVKYQAAIADGGASPLDLSPGCRAVQKTTGIEVLDHDGSSRTEVQTTDDAKQTGWTNSYLPSSVTTGGKLH
jgi:hypothetical protein